MTKIIHCADLHLASGVGERDYSLSVLDEILSIVAETGADLLLIAGDLFNARNEADILRKDVAARFRRLPGETAIFFLAGNHDTGRSASGLGSLDLGLPREHVIEYTGEPCILHPFNADCELLFIPHREDYSDYPKWDLPPRGARYRVAVAHATVPRMNFTGIDEEEGRTGTMDADLFSRWDVDYAAMGHIHSAREAMVMKTRINYPGSARVWRRDETGPRVVTIVELGSGMTVTPREIASAGQYRRVDVPLGLSGEMGELEGASGWGTRDWVDLRLTGLVDDEHEVRSLEERIMRELGERVRLLTVGSDDVMVLDGISNQAIAGRFLEEWKAHEPAAGDAGARAIWLRAREIGLRRIKAELEARR
ncbi:MAG: metallophosphoesterase [Spirochaetes bacterium]|nr:metallophosphoesterase [Spirochaetota bacterium]